MVGTYPRSGGELNRRPDPRAIASDGLLAFDGRVTFLVTKQGAEWKIDCTLPPFGDAKIEQKRGGQSCLPVGGVMSMANSL